MNLGYALGCGASDTDQRMYRARIQREKAGLSARGFDVSGFDATFDAAVARQQVQVQRRHTDTGSSADCTTILAHIGAGQPAR